jgi:hypothetical protein
MTIERDHHGFDASAPLGRPGRFGLPDGHRAGPEIGERLPGIGHASWVQGQRPSMGVMLNP